MATDDEQEQLFVLTKRVKEALELINALDETKLVVIVKRLAKNVGIKGAPFSAEELEQLQEHLVLGEGQVGFERVLVYVVLRVWSKPGFGCDLIASGCCAILNVSIPAGGHGTGRLLLLPGTQCLSRDSADTAVSTSASSGHDSVARTCFLGGVGGRGINGIVSVCRQSLICRR